MTSHLLSQSGWDQAQATSERRGPRGAVWVVAAVYLFSALVFASWIEGWGDNAPQTAAPPPQHQHSTHPTQG